MNKLSTETILKSAQNITDLWSYLSKTNKHIVMYGMGNGADKILSVCDMYNVEVEDFFASDGFVRGHQFHGKTVMSYSKIKEKYGAENIIVLLSFATSLPDVLENIYKISTECELYAPDVPVFGNTLFNTEFYESNIDQFLTVHDLFADKESRRIYKEIIAYKLTGDISHLSACQSSKDEAYRDILCADKISSYADLGAYNGDTIRELSGFAPNLKKIYAFEPDARNFRKLCEYYSSLSAPTFELEAHNIGAWSHDDTLFFDKSGNRNAGLLQNSSDFSDAINARGKKITEIQVNSLDNVLDGRGVDYIKYDVEGSEREALLGSHKTIQNYKPSLLVSLYHRSEDLFDLPLLLHKLNPNYKLYLRRMTYIPAWDINLYAVEK
ncbi:MAG: FkbM family methyltransferase [Ruminococcaceae bacterium]|nr:FkbM family methyltransferase [Oscillospiraceae bacterium]